MSKEANIIFKNLLSSLNALTQVIAKDNKALASVDIAQPLKNLDKKQQFIKDFQELEAKTKNIKQSERVDEKLIAKIKHKFKELENLFKQNDILCESISIVNNKLLDIHKQMKLKQTIEEFGYNKQGEIPALNNIEKIMPAITLNDKV